MTGVSTLGAALDQIERIKSQQIMFTSLSVQMTSGKKSQNFAGLGIDTLVSKRSRADLKSIEAYINNIDNANRRMSLTTNAITQFKAQAKIFTDMLTDLGQKGTHQGGDIVYYNDPLTPQDERLAIGQTSGEADADMKKLQDMAQKIFNSLTDLLNTKDGDRYLFAGAETGSKPMQDTNSLQTALNVMIDKWKSGNISTTGFIADLQDRTTSGGNNDALTDTIVGYSANLSSGNAGKLYVRTSQTNEEDYTTLGNESAFRDILVAASYIKNSNTMPMVDVYKPPSNYPAVPDEKGAPGANLEEQKENFYAVLNSLAQMATKAVSNIDAISYKLAATQTRIQQVKLDYGEQKNLLKSTISDVEDVDTNEVAVKLTSLKTQLEASFQVTAITQQLTLVNYLGFQ